MSDDEIVKVLAERDGFTEEMCSGQGAYYLTDRNILARVIGKMTDAELVEFATLLWNAYRANPKYHWEAFFVLTCDPRVIAECVAKAIQKGKA